MLTDHPYASLTLPDDAAADCLFLRPGLPGTTPFLLHRGGGDLPNSQEVRRGRGSTNQRERRGPFFRSLGGAIRAWLERGPGSGIKTPSVSSRRLCRSSLTSPWFLCPAQNWRRLALASAPSAWCSAHALTAEGLSLALTPARKESRVGGRIR